MNQVNNLIIIHKQLKNLPKSLPWPNRETRSDI